MSDAIREWTYKDLVLGQSRPDFLRSAERVRQLRKHGTRYVGLRGMSVYFRTFSSKYEENNTVWTQEIMLMDLPESLSMRNMSLKDKVLLAMGGDVLVRCDCPAFLYWGFAYILMSIEGVADGQYYGGWSIPGRPPTEPGLYPGEPWRRRNWQQLNVMCKHLMFVGQVFPSHWNSVMADLRKQGYE